MSGAAVCESHSSARQMVAGGIRKPTIQLLGGPTVRVGRDPVVVPEGSTRLLVFVALNGRETDRRVAAGTLWPGGGEQRSAGNLRTALWRLRMAGLDLLDSDKTRLSLRPDTEVDVLTLCRWADSLIAGSAQEADLCTADLRGRLAELLPGWYDDWVIFERERIRQRIMHALEALVRRLIAQRRYADAIEAAIITVSADPLRETAARALIEVHLAEGNVGEARRSYERHRELVRRELGVEPSDELRLLIGWGYRERSHVLQPADTRV